MKIHLVGTKEQREVAFATERYLGLFCGRRWGKTYAFLNRATRRCLSRKRIKYWYVSPVYAQCVEKYSDLVSNNTLRKFIKKTILKPYPIIEFNNGSELGFRTFERPKNLAGSGLNEIWCDEIQDPKYVEMDFWPAIRPLLSDRRGTLVVSGQFSGKDWKYKEFFLKGQEGEHKDPQYRSWNYPSNTGMVYQSDAGKEEFELAKAQLPRRVFEQQYLCLPMANAAAVFDHVDLERSKRGIKKPNHACESVVLGLDLGRVVDPSAMVGIDAADNSVVFAEKRPLDEKHQIGAKVASDIARRYNDATIIVDTTGGATGGHAGNNDAYVQHYREHCQTMRAFTISRENKTRIITNLCLAFEQGKISIPEEFEDLHKELASYEYKCNSNGQITYQGPGGHNDDMVIALALAWEGVRCGWYDSGNSSNMASLVAGIGG